MRDLDKEQKKSRRLSFQFISLIVVLGAPFGLFWSLNNNLAGGSILFFSLFLVSLVAGGWA